MNRKRNRGIAVRVLAVVSGVVLSLQVNVQPASAAYFGTCSSNIWKNWTVIERVKTSPGISGVLANVRVRPLVPCTQSGSIADQSFAPVTLQYNGTDPDRIVQIGYSRCGESGGCNGIPADGWYKAPIVGHEYRMKVESISGPSLANISAADPAEAERFGFQSADELDRVQVLDVFEVNVLDPAIYTDSERLSAFDRLQGTDLWWVVIGVDGTARTVVTVQTAGDAASAVGVGWVPASELLDAMTAAGAAGRAVWIPEYASAVVARTAAGVVVRPLLTDVSSVHVGVARGDTVTGSEYAELLLEHHRAIGGASEQDGAPLGGGISPATPEPSFPPIAVTLIAILAVGVLFARLVVRTGR